MGDKEYVKIEVGTFYRFTHMLEMLIEYSINDQSEYDVLHGMLVDFEHEVTADTWGET